MKIILEEYFQVGKGKKKSKQQNINVFSVSYQEIIYTLPYLPHKSLTSRLKKPKKNLFLKNVKAMQSS
jgi:hypothetical protein